MSQQVWDTINPSSTSGTALATLLNDFKDAMMSGLVGSSRPTETETGGIWVDDSVADHLKVTIYEGAGDVVLLDVNTATGNVSFGTDIDSALTVKKISDDAVGAIFNLYKNRIAGGGQVENGDVVGECDFYAMDDTAVNRLLASVIVTAEEDITSTQFGSKISFELVPVASGVAAEKFSIDGSGNIVAVGNVAGVDGNFSGDLTGATVNSVDDIVVNSGGDEAAADAGDFGLEVEMSDATNCKIGFDSTLTSKFKAGEVGSEAEVMTVSAAQVITNKANDDEVTVKEIATPSNPAAGYQGIYPKADGKWYTINSAGVEQQVGSGSGAGGLNYITNPDAATSVDDWVRYANTSASDRPDDFGGTPDANVTLTRNTTTPLVGDGDFLLTKDASNRQGEGVYIPFTLDDGFVASKFLNELLYLASVNYADGDASIFIVSSSDSFVADFNVMEPVAFSILASTLPHQHQGCDFQTDASDLEYRFCIHISSTNATAYTINYDQVACGPYQYNSGVPASDWEAFATTGSWTSNTTYTGFSRRVGDSLHVKGKIALSGAPNATNLYVLLPNSLSMDTAKLVGSGEGSDLTYGIVSYSDAGVRKGGGQRLAYNSATSLFFRNENATYNQTVPVTWASGDYINYEYTAPIAGWSSNTLMSDQADGRKYTAMYHRTTSQSLPNGATTIINFDTKEDDSHASVTTGASWKFIAQSTGIFDLNTYINIVATSDWDVDENLILYLYKNGSLEKYLDLVDVQSSDTGSLELIVQGGARVKLNKGDYIDLRIYQSSDNTRDTGAGSALCWIDIAKVQGPAQVSSGEKIYAEYNTAAGPAVGTSTTILQYNTKVVDSHNAVVTGASWAFTAPRSDWYTIKNGAYTSTTAAASASTSLAVYKSGVSEKFIPRIQESGVAQSHAGSFSVYLLQDQYIDLRANFQTAGNLFASGKDNWITIESQ